MAVSLLFKTESAMEDIRPQTFRILHRNRPDMQPRNINGTEAYIDEAVVGAYNKKSSKIIGPRTFGGLRCDF